MYKVLLEKPRTWLCPIDFRTYEEAERFCAGLALNNGNITVSIFDPKGYKVA